VRNLPTGNLTFFFSDIEGSTRLLEALGDKYAKLLERHRAIVRADFAANGGTEVNTQGDSFFAVFAEPQDAIRAAVATQRAMAAQEWPQDQPLRIRIGLHTGEARVVAGDYVGLDVHRAARIMAAAHGGEIVASAPTCDEARRSLDDTIQLRDLGEHRLRDLSAPERLYQVLGDGLQQTFPPLRTLDRTPNNLPTQPTPLIGREAELERIRRHLESDRTRILTLTGPGGIGKTRLALQAAANQVDRAQAGIWFVDLAGAGDAPDVLRAIAQTLGVTVKADADLCETIAAHIGDAALLVVLDNFEQVMAAADDVAELLRLCPHLRVIVTSRESLRVRGEQLIEVAPLPCPDNASRPTAADLGRYEAIRLFVERASAARDDFTLTDENAPVIVDICNRLDGLPLAIELAAARLRLFSVEDLRDRLHEGLGVLRGGARDLPERQRTLAGTIAWSHDLLDDDERAVFALMSVFPSAEIVAVEAVAERLDWLTDVDVVDVLASLVDKSLVRGTANGRGQRLSMLETIREFAAERLVADEDRDTQARDAHAAYYLELATTRSAGRGPETATSRRDRFDATAAELDNLLVAWRRFVDRRELGQLKSLLDVLWPLYESRGWYQGGLVLLKDLLAALPETPSDPAHRDKEIVLRMSIARVMLAIQGYTDEVERLYEDAIAVAESAGSHPTQLPVLRSLASFYLYRGNMEKTVLIGQKILRLADAENDADMRIEGQMILGPGLAMSGRWREGLDLLDGITAAWSAERSRASRLLVGPNPGVASAAVSGLLHWQFGFPETADARAATALERADRLGHPYTLAYATFHVGILDLWNGRAEAALDRARRVQAIATANDYLVWQATATVLEGAALALLGDPMAAVERAERGVVLYREHPTPPVFWPQVLGFRAIAALRAGRPSDALAFLDEAAAIVPDDSIDGSAIALQRADVLLALDDEAGAIDALRAAIVFARPGFVRATELRAATLLVGLSAADPAARDLAVESLQTLLPALTEGFETRLVREARAALDDAVGAASA
jgi:predicted ATPase/class 3 adenylate cyclase